MTAEEPLKTTEIQNQAECGLDKKKTLYETRSLTSRLCLTSAVHIRFGVRQPVGGHQWVHADGGVRGQLQLSGYRQYPVWRLVIAPYVTVFGGGV